MRTLPLLILALLLGVPARADVTYNGYLSERMQLTVPSEIALVSSRDLAIMQSLTEGNIQLRFRALDDKLYIYSDTSAFLNFAGGYADTGRDDHVLRFVKEHDVASYRPFFVASEAYASYEFFEHLNILVGKKRVIWGSGFAFNPADSLNPPRDPTDPNFQRAGAYLARLEMPFEKFTATMVFSPKVLTTNAGLPSQVFMYPGYVSAETARNPTVFPDTRDNQPHYAVAARLYALLFDADFNAWLTYTNLYNDILENRPRAAVSFSRYFLTDYEFHVEAMGQLGTARNYVTRDCVVDDASFTTCLSQGKAVTEARNVNSLQFNPRILVGSRTQLKDESTVSIEYLYQGDGYTPDEFQDYMRVQRRVGGFMRSGASIPTAGGGTSSTSELPLRFTFDPLRRHYLFLSYQKTQILDDFSVLLTLINSLEDLSSTLSGNVIWQAQQWMQLSIFAFLPLPSVGRVSSMLPWDGLGWASSRLGDSYGKLIPRGAEVDGERYGEYDALLFRARLVAEMRLFF